MNAFFHRAQHWHLFLLTFGVTFFAMIIFIFFVIGQVAQSIQSQQPPDLGIFLIVILCVSVFTLFIQMGWMWSIGAGMNHLLPKIGLADTRWFKVFFFVIVVYYLVNFWMMYDMFSLYDDAISGRNPIAIIRKIMFFHNYTLLLLPLTLFIIFCRCYVFYFCAKTLKSIELNKEADVGEYIGYFFLFMFNFVGFWIIQPKVNHIMLGDWTPPPPPKPFVYNQDPNFPNDPMEQKEIVPPGQRLKTKDHEAFDHDDDFEGLF